MSFSITPLKVSRSSYTLPCKLGESQTLLQECQNLLLYKSILIIHWRSSDYSNHLSMSSVTWYSETIRPKLKYCLFEIYQKTHLKSPYSKHFWLFWNYDFILLKFSKTFGLPIKKVNANNSSYENKVILLLESF